MFFTGKCQASTTTGKYKYWWLQIIVAAAEYLVMMVSWVRLVSRDPEQRSVLRCKVVLQFVIRSVDQTLVTDAQTWLREDEYPRRFLWLKLRVERISVATGLLYFTICANTKDSVFLIWILESEDCSVVGYCRGDNVWSVRERVIGCHYWTFRENISNKLIQMTHSDHSVMNDHLRTRDSVLQSWYIDIFSSVSV